MPNRQLLAGAAALLLSTVSAQAADPAAGESDFKRCKACHAITAEDGTDIQKGGKTGPNLYGVVGRAAGSAEDFTYGDSLAAAGQAGIVWDVDNLALFITDPATWLKDVLQDPSARSKMTYKHRKGAEDMAAYLAAVSQAP